MLIHYNGGCIMDNSLEVCKGKLIHKDSVNKVINSLPKDNFLNRLADFFKIFGDSTRIKIIYSLYYSELCVCDLVAVIGISQSGISHQLRTLKQMGIVKNRRKGKTMYYSLDDQHIFEILKSGFAHISHV